MKTLVVYTFHEYNDCVKFFIKHGLFESIDVDFYMIINSQTTYIKVDQLNVKVINRENIGHDFGAWSSVLCVNNNHQKYDRYIMINSSVKGPFLPLYVKDNWVNLLNAEVTDSVKLFGTSIGYHEGIVHVQSMVMVTDKIGLKIGIDTGVFSLNYLTSREKVIEQKELGYSTHVLNTNYNIGCLLPRFKGVDFRNKNTVKELFPQNINIFGHEDYYGIEVHPFEVIFLKVPKFGHEYLFKTLERFSVWFNDNKENNFNWKEYLKINRDVFWVNNSEEFAITHYNGYGKYENRKIKSQDIKNWEVYAAVNCDILSQCKNKKSIQEHYRLNAKKDGRRISLDGLDADKFHWIYYKFHNKIQNIVTKIQSIYHYSLHGNLSYYTTEKKKYYLIDLNPLSTSGLLNQIISLVNGILLAWCCNRDLYLTGFYPDYNKKTICSIEEIIDLVHLNNLLKIEDINVNVSEKYQGLPWKKSVLYNGMKVDFNDPKYNHLRGTQDSEPLDQKKLLNVMKYLFYETEEYVDVGDVFEYFAFKESICESLKSMFRTIICNLKFSLKINKIVDYCLNRLSMKEGDYAAIHLRMEDDIIFHRPDKTMPKTTYADHIKKRYEDNFDKILNKDEIIYVSTHLLKAPHEYNYYLVGLNGRFKNLKYWKKPEFFWRNENKDLIEGREIDALIDYALCLRGNKFMGFDGSSFSEIIRFNNDNIGKKTLLV